MDFYIFWKFGFCRTPPSLRQLFYPLVNPIVNLSSIPISPIISPFPHPSYSSLISHPTFIQISSLTPLTLLIPYYPLLPPIPTLHLLTSYPQLIHNLSTAFPQVIHNPYHFNRPFIYPFIPTYIAISPIIPIIIPTQFPSKVIHRYTKLSTSYPQSNILIHRLSTDISILSYV